MKFVKVRAKWLTSVDNYSTEPETLGKHLGGVTRKAGEEFDFPEHLVSSEPSLELATAPKDPQLPATKK